MDIDKAKHLISGLYDISLNCICDDIISHPVRIIEASKSIIGINPENPESKLLDYCERYISKFKHSVRDFDFSGIEMPSVVSYLDLELSILDNNKEKSFKNLYYLSRVSDGSQILEFLLEISLKYRKTSFLLVWSVYRMHLFLGFDNIFKSLSICVENILNDEKVERDCRDINIEKCFEEYVFHKNTFKYFCSLYRIGNDDLVRKDKIRKFIASIMKNDFAYSNKLREKNVIGAQERKGRAWILEYLSNIEAEKINNELILNLDAARGVLKISNNKNINLIWGHLNEVL